MKLSIIIPIYNLEKHIASCLDSVLSQDISSSEYEIITVDDGSKDRSGEIISAYSDKHPNILCLKKANGGPGSARNYGLQHAKGDYIWFVDGDDRIAKNCLLKLLDYVYKLDLDFCDLVHVNVFGTTKIIVNKNRRLYGKVVSNVEFISQYAMPYAACFHLIRRETIVNNKIFFIKDIFHEDVEFNIRLLQFCNRISFYDYPPTGLYFYVNDRPQSTMANKDLTHIEKRISSYIRVLKETVGKFSYDKNSRDYGYYVHKLSNDIITNLFIPLISESEIEGKANRFKKIISENELDYNADVTTGLSRIKFLILSTVRRNYFLTIFFLWLFDKVAVIKARLNKGFI